jgi:BirA family biotin operon repressor/biotin-[acetyl-CoA-carboxylase] ligase
MRKMAAAREIIRLEVVESTNSAALDAGKQGAAPGTVFVAASQTGGRGRLNRSWLSPPGMGLYFSLLLRPHLAVGDLPKITLAAGLAMCKVVEAAYGLAPQIKWPNDLLLSGRKFGGILTETGSQHSMSAGSPPIVVVGVGLNLFPPDGGFPPELKARATSLALHMNRKISADILLEAGISAIENVVARLEKGDFPKILKEWMQRDASRGKVLTWVTPRGKEVTGVSLGPDADGALRVKDRSGTIHTVLSGDVALVGKIPAERSQVLPRE